jgi:ribosomal protein S18 acetylase RimI-like enzyme
VVRGGPRGGIGTVSVARMAAVTLRPMTDDEYVRWVATSIAGYADSFVQNGTMSAEEAQQRSEKDFAELLPDGRDTPEQHIWTVIDADTGAAVGSLWINVRDRGIGRTAFVYDIEIDETQQGKGYGRATMLAGEVAAKELGATTIGLNVFGFNTVAINLYTSLGYTVTSQNMAKPLT